MGSEASFIQRVGRELRMKGWFFYKIPDGARGGRRPFDVFSVMPVDGGRVLCIEFKVGRTLHACLSNIALYQYQSLRAVAKTGGFGVFCFGIGGKRVWLDVREIERVDGKFVVEEIARHYQDKDFWWKQHIERKVQ
jgi:hypothetical protein